MTAEAQTITSVANGVPFVALPPAGGARADASLVVAWHMMDAPRTEAAFAAALPLAGLNAWRIYFGLPMTGSRLPEGGLEALYALAAQDAVLKMHGPVVAQALEELPAALAEIRAQFGIQDGPIGVVGGSIGAAVALRVIADRVVPVEAAVVISPVVQLRATVAALSQQFGVTYEWTPPADAIADELDFIARAGELEAASASILAIAGSEDEPFVAQARNLRDALAARSVTTDLVVVEGMGHGLAEEPGVEPAPQTQHASEVDAHAVAWFRRHLARA